MLLDPRYKPVGESISELDLKEENGVISIIKQLKYGERYLDYG